MVTRRPVAKNIKVLPPETVPMNLEDHEQAVTSLAHLIERWWRNDHRDEAATSLGNKPITSRTGPTETSPDLPRPQSTQRRPPA
jgi:hypothetical protein